MIEYNFDGYNVIVTGGSMGLGKSITEEFVKSGANVLIADIDLDAAENTKEEFEKYPGKVYIKQCDISNHKDVESMVKYAKSVFKRIDVLINNAGICECLPLIDQKLSVIDKMLKININGVIYATREVAPIMKQQKFGRIINMSSIAAKMSGANASVYSATKAAVLSFTASTAREYARDGITVNCVLPGIIRTPLWETMLDENFAKNDKSKKDEIFKQFTDGIPTGKPQEPVDIANAVLFLCSRQADNITAQNLGVDGGQTY